MDKRIKELRKTLELTMEEFGSRLGVTRTAISNIENGHRNVTEQMFKSICREFNVSYAWLKDGLGEMFTNIPETILDELIDEYNLDFLDKQIIKKYLQLSNDERDIIKKYIKSLSDE